MTSERPDTKIMPGRSSSLMRPTARTLANRGLSDLEATKRADKWLELASELRSRESDKLSALLHSRKVDFRTKKGRKPFERWSESSEHHVNMTAYFDCLQRAVAVKSNYPKVLMEVAQAHLNGWGVAESRDEALRVLRSAAEVASPDDLWKMSIMIKISNSDPWPKGMKEAKTMCRKAAEQGHAGAQYSLGEMYAKGEGGPSRDDKLAMFWFGKAAENGEFPPAEGELKYWKSKAGRKKAR